MWFSLNLWATHAAKIYPNTSSLVKVLQPRDLAASETVQENLHAGPSQQVHQDVVHEGLRGPQAKVDPCREAVDVGPERHGGDGSSSMWIGC